MASGSQGRPPHSRLDYIDSTTRVNLSYEMYFSNTYEEQLVRRVRNIPNIKGLTKPNPNQISQPHAQDEYIETYAVMAKQRLEVESELRVALDPTKQYS